MITDPNEVKRLPRHIETGYLIIFVFTWVYVVFLLGACYRIRYIAGIPTLALFLAPILVRAWHGVFASPPGTRQRTRTLARAALATLLLYAAIAMLAHLHP